MKSQIFTAIIAVFTFFSCQKDDSFVLSTNTHDTFWLDTQGAKMPVHVRGNTASKTFVIVLHGGPGATSLGYLQPFENSEKDYAFVYWDQRNSGFSQGAFNQKNVVVPNYIKDLEKLVVLLKHGYGDNIGIFLFGHSWGGYLGTAFLGKPENNTPNIKGWIDLDGVHDFPTLNQFTKEMLMRIGNVEIAAGRNKEKWQPIVNFAQHTDVANIDKETTMKLNIHAWNAQFLMGVPEPTPSEARPIPILLQLSTFLLGKELDHDRFVDDFLHSSEVRNKMPNIKVPTLLIWGEWDFPVPPAVADDAYEQLKNVPYKKKVILPLAGHNAIDDQPEMFEMIFKEFVEQFK